MDDRRDLPQPDQPTARAAVLPPLSTSATARVALAVALCAIAVVQVLRAAADPAQVATGFVIAWIYAVGVIIRDLANR